MAGNVGSDQESLDEARNTVIEALVQVYSLYGLSDVLGRIYGVLFFADHPLGLEEIAGERSYPGRGGHRPQGLAEG
jgi:DNA-binding transcriptional regulator GbsR (MarR family)